MLQPQALGPPAAHPVRHQAQFQQTNVVRGIGEGTGGVTEALRRRIVLPTGGTLADLDHVIGHELTHAFQYDITGHGTPTSLGAVPAAAAASRCGSSREWRSTCPRPGRAAHRDVDAWRDPGHRPDSLPTYRQLEDPRYFPYRYGQALLAYIARHYGATDHR